MTLTSPSRRRNPARLATWHRWSRHSVRPRHVPAIPVQSRAGRVRDQREPISPPGVIGGAVIAAARRSAGLSRRTLARSLAVTPATVRAWETGALPLYRVSYDDLRELANQLAESGALASPTLNDLLLASQCDLLLTGMLGGFEDYAEVPPVDHESAGAPARGLLRWALAGEVPEQCRRHARAGRLLAAADIIRFRMLARELAGGARGPELASYGAALASVAAGEMRPNSSRRAQARRRQPQHPEEER